MNVCLQLCALIRVLTKSGQVYEFALSKMLFAGLLFLPGYDDVVMGPDKKDYTDN